MCLVHGQQAQPQVGLPAQVHVAATRVLATAKGAGAMWQGCIGRRKQPAALAAVHTAQAFAMGA